MDRWRDRVSVVTGAGSGIGEAICIALVEAGMKTVAIDINKQSLTKLQETATNLPGEYIPLVCDITKDEQVVTAFEYIENNLGGADVCINNAGISDYKSLLDGDLKKWRSVLDCNVVGLCHCTKLSIQSMRKRGVDDGHIINISSMAGHKVGRISHVHFYTATKFAVRALTEGFRQELREANSKIKISAISPGSVKTNILKPLVGDGRDFDDIYKNINPLTPKDIATTVIHALASPPNVEIMDVLIGPVQDFEN